MWRFDLCYEIYETLLFYNNSGDPPPPLPPPMIHPLGQSTYNPGGDSHHETSPAMSFEVLETCMVTKIDAKSYLLERMTKSTS